jgi:hypothetical protein
MKKVTCPNCNNYGSPPTMEESMKAFGIEEDQNIGAFRQRGQIEGKPIWVCNQCDAGLWIKFFGKPKLIMGDDLKGLKDDWESGTGSKF